MNVNEKIIQLGEGLKERIGPSLVSFALEYIGFGENILAFETLCDQIADHDILLSKDEYLRVLEIVSVLNLEMNSRYTYINPEK